MKGRSEVRQIDFDRQRLHELLGQRGKTASAAVLRGEVNAFVDQSVKRALEEQAKADANTFTYGDGWFRHGPFQVCHTKNLTVSFDTADRLIATWTYRQTFIEIWNVVITLPATAYGAHNGVAAIDLGETAVNPGIVNSVIIVRRATGAPNFTAGDNVTKVTARAEGLWR